MQVEAIHVTFTLSEFIMANSFPEIALLSATKGSMTADTAFLPIFQKICNLGYRSNQIFYYTPCITPTLVTSLRGPSPRHCAHATQLFSK